MKIKILIPVYNDWKSVFKVLDEINTKSSKPTGRINEHTILLRTE